ncbi:multidrug efflux SMR transporter [Jannaschia sp. Os4]|uniref:DMT family transporter n=1 Tax=Jannaschia sp. Os4 TaxID=2807617 RepID=UPI0019396D1D|nr:multidrug efflux SMR transporter [Jannaschia sp. Os4]MBM2577421.1 multidrug efflux SMR transporter [Jannaschia sp. Os4]
MHWIYLALAAAFEVAFALSMKLSDGFTRPLWSAVTVVAVVFGIGFLTLALRTLPVSIGYPIWTAAGTLGTVALGWAVLGEDLTPLKIASAALIVCGVAGLKMSA